MCLFVDEYVILPDGIGNLPALEELSEINLRLGSVNFIQGLGRLTKLKAIEIIWHPRDKVCDEEGYKRASVSSLSKLATCCLRSLRVLGMDDSDYLLDSWMDSCSSTPPLQRLVLDFDGISRIPSRLSSLFNLTRLSISFVRKVGQEDLKILASLPAMLSLTLEVNTKLPGKPDDWQPRITPGRLVKLNFHGWGSVAFELGAMPKFQRLKLQLSERCKFKCGGLVSGVRHLSGLTDIAVSLYCWGALAKEVQALEDGISMAAKALPLRPTLKLHKICDFQRMRPKAHPFVEKESIAC